MPAPGKLASVRVGDDPPGGVRFPFAIPNITDRTDLGGRDVVDEKHKALVFARVDSQDQLQ
jgi:hypothetical protein